MITPLKILEINNRKEKQHKVISYSQLSMFLKCPHSWKLKYIDRIKFDSISIHLPFGNAFHETMQEYVESYLNDTIEQANDVNFENIIPDKLYKEYERFVIKNKNEHFSNPSELTEFSYDGIYIMNWIKKHISDYIHKSTHHFIGTEVPIYYKLQNNLYFNGYIDQLLGFKNQNDLLLWDYKTSTRGWGPWQKKDKIATLQMVLYKYFILKELGLDIRKNEKFIKPQYFIVRRKLIDDSEFLQKRVQIFEPSNGIVTLNKAKKYLDHFVHTAFKEDSKEYNLEYNYPAITGVSQNNCKFCKLKDNDNLCPKHLRKTAEIIKTK